MLSGGVVLRVEFHDLIALILSRARKKKRNDAAVSP